MIKTRFDIDCENFDLYFAKQIPAIAPEVKQTLPKDVLFKLFRKGGEFNAKSTSKLGFLAKLFILWKCLNKRWWIVVEDEHKGMSIEQFFEHKKDIKKREYGITKAEGLASTGCFVLASKELGDCFEYLNRLSVSPAYNYISKAKNKIPNKTAEWNEQMKYILRFITCYEGGKKSWSSSNQLSIPEWYVLAALFHGKDVPGSILYQETFKRAYQSSPNKIKRSFSTLQSRGYIEKTGLTRGATLRITSLGKSVVVSILEKYAINC
jgi:hypothetical protein